MLSVLLHFIFNPGFALVAVLVIIALGAAYAISPANFLKLITNTKLWLAAIVAAGCFGFVSLSHQNDALKAKIQVQQTQTTATTDAQQVVDHIVVKRQARAAQSQDVQKAIDNANPGDAEDSAMDAIAAQQRSSDVGGSQPVRVQHAPQPPAQP